MNSTAPYPFAEPQLRDRIEQLLAQYSEGEISTDAAIDRIGDAVDFFLNYL